MLEVISIVKETCARHSVTAMTGAIENKYNGHSDGDGPYSSVKEASSERYLNQISNGNMQFQEKPTINDSTVSAAESKIKTTEMAEQGEDEEVLIDIDTENDKENIQWMVPQSLEVGNNSAEVDSDYDDDPEPVHSQKISAEERLERLSLLLQKSQVYADSLLEVIENRKEIERKKALKREKALLKASKKAAGVDALKAKKRPRQSDSVKGPKKKKSKMDRSMPKMCDSLLSKIYFPKESEVVDQISVRDGIRLFGDKLISASQPALFTGGMLHDYQIKGFQWLKVLFVNAINGILADEMGLGKTIQCIALLCHIIKSGFKGPFLVCAPMSVAFNWVNELKLFAPSIPTILYHGTKEDRRELAKHIMRSSEIHDCHPVVVTTYEMVFRDSSLLAKYNWDYMILDEGHRVKNIKCKLLRKLKCIRAGAKLILTGTPLQNNLQELWSLLHFLIPEVFDDLQVFESWFDLSPTDGSKMGGVSLDQERKFLTTLYEILTPFLLRRVKDDVEIEIPPKAEIIVYTPLSRKQERFYQASVDKTIRQVVKDKVNNHEADSDDLSSIVTVGRMTRGKAENLGLNIPSRSPRPSGEAEVNVSLNNIMMLLRKCCNHPYLIEYPLIPGTDLFKVDEEIVSSSGKLMVMDQILPELKKNKHRVLLFSQMVKMLDIIEDYLRFRGHSFLRLDGSTQLHDRHANMKEFNSNPDVFIFLLSTRAGGLGVNLTGADTVIIYDSDWNPQNDLQAQDRCHRIGQTQPVMIYRLVTAGSVDQRMVENAAAKRRLEKMVMHKDKFKGDLDVELKTKMKLGKNEIMKLLEATDIKCVVDYKKALPEDELARILDRSFLHKQ